MRGVAMARRLLIAWAAMAVLVLASGCATLVSDQQEIELGAQYRQQLAKEVALDRDPGDLGYVNALGQSLVRAAPAQRPGMPFTFDIVQDRSLNAFAIPGGHVYVNSGTIRAASNESELAAVMAHEIGHVVGMHHKETIGRELGLNMVNELILGAAGQSGDGAGAAAGQPSAGAQSAVLLTQVVEKGVLLKFSRDQEYQADDLAIPTLIRAGYDPNGLVTFFDKLMAQGGGGGGGKVFEMFSSHPLTEERIQRARATIAQYPRNPNAKRDAPAFQALKARVY
ncbi:MAG: M48 family metallopeptidase [Candidatus Sumerlaeota bacterium]|nr:M48 family metallopeptidase [Candidatus Sumerlaeota bacterium]